MEVPYFLFFRSAKAPTNELAPFPQRPMFYCTTCIRRCLRDRIGDAFDSAIVQRPYAAPITTHRPGRVTHGPCKSYATAAGAYLDRRKSEGDGKGQAVPTTGRYARGRWRQDPIERSPRKHSSVTTPFEEGGSSELSRVPQFDKAVLEKELRYLHDPLKLADHTINLLKKDDYHKALELVKMSSRNMSCTVSWNHLMDYEMYTGRVSNALKIYNDVQPTPRCSGPRLCVCTTDEEAGPIP